MSGAVQNLPLGAIKAMTTDYESFLHVTEDGRIWWLRQDAVRLGAGFLPVCDDNQQLEPQLQAPNQRALVNEKTLIGGLGDARSSVQFAGALTPVLDAEQAAKSEIERANKEIAFLEKELARLKELEGAMEKWETLTKALADAKRSIGMIRQDIEKAKANAR
jgi:predicted  nucleic acid-binding Zn-ribbon protein